MLKEVLSICDRHNIPYFLVEGTLLGEFEGMSVKILAKAHEILMQLYGDYMKLPPLDKRKGSHVSCLIETEENGAR